MQERTESVNRHLQHNSTSDPQEEVRERRRMDERAHERELDRPKRASLHKSSGGQVNAARRKK